MGTKRHKSTVPVDFSLRVYTEENMFGPLVKVVSRLFTGEVRSEWMPVCWAVDYVLRDPDMGRAVKSARIEFRGVYDEWGQSY